MRWLAAAALMCALLLVSCKQEKAEGMPLSGEPQVGAMYSLNDGEGAFRAGKVLVVEEGLIFIHLYGNRWPSRPSRATAKKAGDPMAVAYSSQSFSSMQPLHLENGSVSPEELDDYQRWKRSPGRGIF
jgi:hypothetical protein